MQSTRLETVFTKIYGKSTGFALSEIVNNQDKLKQIIKQYSKCYITSKQKVVREHSNRRINSVQRSLVSKYTLTGTHRFGELSSD